MSRGVKQNMRLTERLVTPAKFTFAHLTIQAEQWNNPIGNPLARSQTKAFK